MHEAHLIHLVSSFIITDTSVSGKSPVNGFISSEFSISANGTILRQSSGHTSTQPPHKMHLSLWKIVLTPQSRHRELSLEASFSESESSTRVEILERLVAVSALGKLTLSKIS